MSTKSGILALLSALLLMVGCTGADKVKALKAPSELPGQVYDTATGRPLSTQQLITLLKDTDYLLLGEKHDDPIHHDLQYQIVQALIEAGKKPAVVFEMFNREDSGVIATAARNSPANPDPIAKAVNWEDSGWPDWQWYRPIVAAALKAKLPIVAGNIARPRLQLMAFGQGSDLLTPRMLQTYGLLQSLPDAQSEHLQGILASAHGSGEKMAPWMLQGFLKAQRLRDASMADSMITRNSGQGAILITGQIHARNDFGVPYYLRYREPGARIASLAFIESNSFKATQSDSKLKTTHDYVWVLPNSQGLRTAQK
ncbi:MAG: ChaN family lipoprotein [Candidatus Thiodiazotropha sp. (ex Ctena orbiculata)]|nr:ChaN family lipoprotein [Candidatus Thiodiazotropha taylori]